MMSKFCLNPYYTGIHLPNIEKALQRGHSVLILIILEYIYLKLWFALMENKICLNPYYTGIHLPRN